MQYIGFNAAFITACTALHLAAIWAWQHCKWTAARPLPEWMYPPAVELLLVNILGLPLAMYSVILLVQGQHAGSRLLGAVVGLAVLLYLFALVALLRLIFRNKPRLGLIYVPERPPSSSSSSSSVLSRRFSNFSGSFSSSKLAPLVSGRQQSFAGSRQGSGVGNSTYRSSLDTARSVSGDLTDVPSAGKLPAGPVAEGMEHAASKTEAAAAEAAAADADGGDQHCDGHQEGSDLQRNDTGASNSAKLVPLEDSDYVAFAPSISHGSWHMWQIDGEGQDGEKAKQGGYMPGTADQPSPE
jgi:hypothetical protein